MIDNKLQLLINAKQKIANHSAAFVESKALLNKVDTDIALKKHYFEEHGIHGHQAYEYFCMRQRNIASVINEVKVIELNITATSVHSFLLMKGYVKGNFTIDTLNCSIDDLLVAFDDMITLRKQYFKNFLNKK